MVRCFDLFCGGGGSSYGATLANLKIVGGMDNWEIAIKVFKDNFPNATTYQDSVDAVSPRKVLSDVGPIDFLLASPECTNHSCARGRRAASEESRETALQVLRFAQVLNPRWIILENVIHMRPWSRYQELLAGLRQMRYAVAEHVLDSSDFGVPQRRKRLFLLCDNAAIPPKRLSKRPGRKPSASRILDPNGTWPTDLLYGKGRAEATIERAERGFDAVGRDTPFLIVYYGSDGAGGWQSLRAPLRTITTLDRFGLIQPSPKGPTLRMLQVSELQRAMGFREDFHMRHGTRRDRIRLLGNGVCAPVMSAAIKALLGH